MPTQEMPYANKTQCYIGHKTLDHAIALYQKTYPRGSLDKFIFTFSPYYLNPDDPVQGIPWSERVAQKNGQERVNAIRTRLQRVGRANGIEFSFDGKIGQTKDSHRLMHFAPLEARKTLLEEIFKAHFEHDADITLHEDLTNMAVSAGLERAEIVAFLESGYLGDEVDHMASQARKAGVSSVPTIEINGRRFEGAQDVSEFYEALVQAKQITGEHNTDP